MGLIESIYEWRQRKPWRRRPRLDGLPFEELQERYDEDPGGVYKEFIRRLRGLVFWAVNAYMTKINPGTSRDTIEEKTMNIFQEFSPQFIRGEPQTILLRFAAVIRSELDDEVFRAMGVHYYKQLPIYHINDDEARRFLAAAFQYGLHDGEKPIEEMLAERFNETPERVESILTRANAHLKKVIKKDFTPDELKELTEGYVH